MKVVKLNCPSCGSALEAEDNLETFYCKYCGQKIILAEQSKSVLGAKMFSKFLEHRERMARQKAEEERIKREHGKCTNCGHEFKNEKPILF